jgi:hypothetical protein
VQSRGIEDDCSFQGTLSSLENITRTLSEDDSSEFLVHGGPTLPNVPESLIILAPQDLETGLISLSTLSNRVTQAPDDENSHDRHTGSLLELDLRRFTKPFIHVWMPSICFDDCYYLSLCSQDEPIGAQTTGGCIAIDNRFLGTILLLQGWFVDILVTFLFPLFTQGSGSLFRVQEIKRDIAQKLVDDVQLQIDRIAALRGDVQTHRQLVQKSTQEIDEVTL